MPIPDDSLQELASLGEVALLHDDIDTALRQICTIAVRAVPGAVGASLTSMSTSGPQAVASSDPWAEELDELQYGEHEGPCLDAARTGLVFRVRDVAGESRWPAYMPRAHELGVQSMVSLPTTSESKTIGALNLYSKDRDAFGAEEVSIGQIVAGHASLASQVASTLFRHRDLAAQLQEAMQSRAVIEQAKGVLMATTPGIDADAAFGLLRSASQRENRKLRTIATEIVERCTARKPAPDAGASS